MPVAPVAATRGNFTCSRVFYVQNSCNVSLWWVLNASGRDFLSSHPSVVMVQPNKNRNTNDGVIGLWHV
jgi:hypothetical protein